MWTTSVNGQKDYYRSVPGIQRDRIMELLKETNIKVSTIGGSERIDVYDRYQWPSHGKSRQSTYCFVSLLLVAENHNSFTQNTRPTCLEFRPTVVRTEDSNALGS